MPKINITEKIEIGVPAEEIYGYLKDLKRWREWSPWLVCEEDCELEFSKDGKQWYGWDGKYVGAGKMSLKNAVKNESLEYFLEFLRPWKSKAQTQLNLRGSQNGVSVEWCMQGSVPWFMWWMRPTMVRMIRMNYERGLSMLKEKLETGEVDSRLEYSANEAFPARAYIGIKRACSMNEFEERMGSDFKKLTSVVKEKGIEVTEFFSVYEVWNLGKGEVVYTVCAGVDGEVEVPDGFVLGLREACDAFVVKHTGGYHHLGNAWAAGMVRAQSKPPLFKQSKKVMPFEIYDCQPGCGEEVVTRVVMPLA